MMETAETSVRLVVKAPNQQIDDQVVECTLDWTVQKLKTHLSEVYPSKPGIDEQKLIYSGRLLHDHLMLKEFLRQYDTESVHTVHLVCLPPPHAHDGKPSSIKARISVDSVSAAMSDDGRHHHHSMTSNPTYGNELRHRFANIQSPMTNQFLNPGLGAAVTTTPPPLPSSPPMMANFGYPPMVADQVAQQMAWMQQVYGHYVNSYFQQLHGVIPTPEVPTREAVIGAPPSPPQPAAAAAVPANAPVAAAAAVVANENIRMNAQGGPLDDDDEAGVGNGGRWDLLDWAYVLSRVTILFSIVYFYSSLSRFLVVTVVAIVMYLYKTGWLGARRLRHDARPDGHPEAARPVQPDVVEDVDDAVAEEEATENADIEQMERETREIEELMNRGMENDGNNSAIGNRIVARVLWLWTFMTTFFTSLLPETPIPANFN